MKKIKINILLGAMWQAAVWLLIGTFCLALITLVGILLLKLNQYAPIVCYGTVYIGLVYLAYRRQTWKHPAIKRAEKKYVKHEEVF